MCFFHASELSLILGERVVMMEDGWMDDEGVGKVAVSKRNMA